jgi:hypothetical protein
MQQSALRNRTLMQATERTETLSKALGWFSIGLGVTELVAPRVIGRVIGAPDDRKAQMLTRAYGLREIAAGVGILRQPREARWMWSRVAGDAMDLATLGRVITTSRSGRGRAVAATAAVLGVTALDILCSRQLSNGRRN